MANAATVCLVISGLLILTGAILIAIGFGTNNWKEYAVSLRSPQCVVDPNMGARSVICHNRIQGLFRLCYPKQSTTPVSNVVSLFKDYLGYTCSETLDYARQSREEMIQSEKDYLHLMKTYLSFYIVAFILVFLAMLLFIAGSCRRSCKLLIAAGTLCFFAAGFIGAAIGVWHRVQEINKENLQDTPSTLDDPFYWVPPGTTASYGWSYMIAWIGAGFLLLASILICASAGLVNRQKRIDEISVITGGAEYLNYGHNPSYAAYCYGTYNPYLPYYAPYYLHYYDGNAKVK